MQIITLPSTFTDKDVADFIEANKKTMKKTDIALSVGDVDKAHHRQGTHKIYAIGKNGVYMSAKYHYQDDKLHGKQKELNEIGKATCLAHWKNGKQHGPMVTWHDNGCVADETHWVHGKKQGISQTWYKNGQLRSKVLYAGDDKLGTEQTWHDNGQLASEQKWILGARQGVSRTWDRDGSLNTVNTYFMDKHFKSYNMSLFQIQLADVLLGGIGYKRRDTKTLADDQFKALQRRHSALRV